MTALLTLAEACERLRCDPKTLRREARDGRIRLVPIRGTLRVREDELERYIRDQEAAWCRSAAAASSAARFDAAVEAAAVLADVLHRTRPEAVGGKSKLRAGSIRLAESMSPAKSKKRGPRATWLASR